MHYFGSKQEKDNIYLGKRKTDPFKQGRLLQFLFIPRLPCYSPLWHRGDCPQVAVFNFLKDASVLDPFQSGFCASYGTDIVLVTFTDDLHKQMDQGRSALLLLHDLTPVFDMVDHDFLTHHFTYMG